MCCLCLPGFGFHMCCCMCLFVLKMFGVVFCLWLVVFHLCVLLVCFNCGMGFVCCLCLTPFPMGWSAVCLSSMCVVAGCCFCLWFVPHVLLVCLFARCYKCDDCFFGCAHSCDVTFLFVLSCVCCCCCCLLVIVFGFPCRVLICLV